MYFLEKNNIISI